MSSFSILSRSSYVSFLLRYAYLFFFLVCWVNKIHQDNLLSVSICLFHLVFSRRRLSAVITAVFCEGKVPRIDNEEDVQTFFFLFTHMTRHVSIQSFWFISNSSFISDLRERLCMSRCIFWLKTIKQKMKKTNGDAKQSSADHTRR